MHLLFGSLFILFKILNKSLSSRNYSIYSLGNENELFTQKISTDVAMANNMYRMLSSECTNSEGGIDKQAESALVEAFTTLADKDLLRGKLCRTRLCRFVLDGTVCPYGTGCRFAHHASELVPPECVFGAKCRFVTAEDGGVLVNCGTKVCRHKHPCESKLVYEKRVRNGDLARIRRKLLDTMMRAAPDSHTTIYIRTV